MHKTERSIRFGFDEGARGKEGCTFREPTTDTSTGTAAEGHKGFLVVRLEKPLGHELGRFVPVASCHTKSRETVRGETQDEAG
jgi:hypothetical protein